MKPGDFIPALQNGRTELLTGFKSKGGKAFDAYLAFDAKANKFSFEFADKPAAQNGGARTLKLTKPKGKGKRKR